MAWSVSDYFPSWGDTGEKPPSNKNYSGGEQVNEKHFDYLWNALDQLEAEVWSALSDIDSDKDGKVDAADTADTATDATNVTATYKGNDIDNDGDGIVNASHYTQSVEQRNDDPSSPDGRVWIRTDL